MSGQNEVAGGLHLVVVQRDAEDVGEEEDDFVFGIVAAGRGHIALDAPDFLNLAYMFQWLAVDLHRDRLDMVIGQRY